MCHAQQYRFDESAITSLIAHVYSTRSGDREHLDDDMGLPQHLLITSV